MSHMLFFFLLQFWHVFFNFSVKELTKFYDNYMVLQGNGQSLKQELSWYLLGKYPILMKLKFYEFHYFPWSTFSDFQGLPSITAYKPFNTINNCSPWSSVSIRGDPGSNHGGFKNFQLCTLDVECQKMPYALTPPWCLRGVFCFVS